ncbi:MFS transporter [Streptomyces botrytidirepellens]|uniref:MFS transporter n=1 Tax=Streptomyces botrytidirepellens TaxID=2486417 RepID=UPI001C838723|nr:MFS transporter [Streptomyces botrytidirepellens]
MLNDGQEGPAPSHKKLLIECVRNRNITLVAATTLLTQVVYMGTNVVLPAYLHNVVGLSLAASAGLSVVFTLTGILGQVLWPTLSDIIGRRTTIIVCGLWMALSVGCFYFATSSLLVVVIQLAFGLVANAVWPIYYAAASDVAPAGAPPRRTGSSPPRCSSEAASRPWPWAISSPSEEAGARRQGTRSVLP